MLHRDGSRMMLVGALLVCAACKSTPAIAMSAQERSALQARYPIAVFQGFEPYSDGRRTIDAYVDIARDGLLRASLGCAVWTVPYSLNADRTLVVTDDFVEPDYSRHECSDGIAKREKELASFLSTSPKVGKWRDDGTLTISGSGDGLVVASVDHVLNYN
jgi:hypothetical protein